MKKVLVVDDEKAIVQMLSMNLKSLGYNVIAAYDGYEALDILNYEKVDVILLDIMMPDMDGIEVCNRIKSNPETRVIPIIMVSAKTQIEDKVLGLNNGADDYLIKPFDIQELRSRIDAAIRQVETIRNQQSNLKKGNISIDLNNFRVLCASNELDLTITEFKILSELLKTDKALNKDFLTNLIYGNDLFQNKRVLDVHIRNLRKKLESNGSNCKIITLRGIGYTLEIQQD